jgi:manganese/zinc/iron transport system substrate-binding protein
VAAIGGERIDGWVLIQGNLDPHSYEMVKGDGDKMARADLIFYNGLGLEHGAGLSSLLHASPKALAIGEKIAAAHPERVLKRGEVIDPHIWMDISLWQQGIDPIVEALSAVDPEGSAYYQRRGALLAGQMETVHREIRERLLAVPSQRRYLVTSHDAFHYFTRSYLADTGEADWAERFAAPEGLAPEGQLRAHDIQKIIHYLKERRIAVLFPESNVNRDSIRKIASVGKELGLEVRVCEEPLYGDAMSGLSYLDMMRKNAETIARYL